MSVNMDRIEDYIGNYYEQHHSDLIITRRMKERISSVITGNENIGMVSADVVEQKIMEFLERENTLHFIRERQPQISVVPDAVVDEIKNYFTRELVNYELLSVYRKSNHLEDAYLYSVLARNSDGEYACWTVWNDSTKSLNHGHTGLNTREEAMSILKENFHDITGEPEKFGIDKSCKEVETIENMQLDTNRQEKVFEGVRKNAIRQHR